MVIDLAPGTALGGYRIEEYIGRGGMGMVYRAEHLTLGRKVAIKMLAPELAESESFRDRFVRESWLAASIDHPNVIPIYEADEHDGTYFIAMRYVDGVDLKEVLVTEGRLHLDRTLSLLGQVAGALDAAHARGLVHRDVKPGNVLVCAGSDHCYLTDFGLTKAVSSNTGFTATGQFVGTVDYVAPEQIDGRAFDARTDVYSLGCILYECLAGAPPFKRDTDMAAMWAHMKEPPPRVTDARPDLPVGLDDVVATAMAKSKDHRYPTCSALMAAAAAACGMTNGSAPVMSAVAPPPTPPTEIPAAVPSGAFTRQDATPPAPSIAEWTPPPQLPPEEKSGKLTAIALVIAALLLAGGGTAAALIVTSEKDEGSNSSAPATPQDDGGPSNEQAPPADEPDEIEKTPPSEPEQPAPETDVPTDKAAVEATIYNHWDLINSQDFEAAFDLFGPNYAGRVDRSDWVQDHIDEEIESAEVLAVTVPDISDNTVTADLSVQTRDRHGCQVFTGTYGMLYDGSTWLIDDPQLTKESC